LVLYGVSTNETVPRWPHTNETVPRGRSPPTKPSRRARTRGSPGSTPCP